MEENKRDIEEIIKQLNNKSAQAPAKFRDSDVEFEIGKREEAPEEKNPVKEPVSVEEEEEDGSLPSIFDIAEKEESNALSDGIFRFKSTYVPRFTDASQKYSRRGYDSDNEKSTDTELALTVEKESVDPTAEIDTEANNEAKIVNVNSVDELIADTSTLFKFDDGEIHSEKTELTEDACTSSEAQVAASIPETEAQALPEAERLEEKAEAATVIDIEEPFSQKLPEIYVPTSVASRENITGVGDAVRENEKSEFTAAHKRDGVKDRFLDTLLSQKVRFIVALALSIALLIFENLNVFGVDLISAFHFEGMVNALAIIDIQ